MWGNWRVCCSLEVSSLLLTSLESGLLAADVLLGLSFGLLTLKTFSSEQFGCHALPISHARSFPTKQHVDVEGGAVSVFR